MNSRSGLTTIAIGAALCAATFAVFQPALQNGFINFDDPGYVTSNYHVRRGLDWETVAWSFGTSHAGNWHPLTWLSHALDCQFHGLKPAGHHLTNVLLHMASALLLFQVLRRATGAIWRSAFVAAFFALHPLRVESVAWVAERKDVLSAFFFMLTLWAYARYAQRTAVSSQQPGVAATGTQANAPVADVRPLTSGSYWLALFFFALGLMSKPMLVTVPFVLLLLDYWPFRRFTIGLSKPELTELSRLALEKIPFFLLTAMACVVTFVVQTSGGNTNSLPLSFRVANSLIAYATYCGKMFWPSDLAIFYPRPEVLTVGTAATAAIVLLLLSALSLWLGRSRRYLLTGWLWYLVMLAPVCGLIAIGAHAMADRYTYLPGIGVALAVVWGAAELAARRPRGQRALATLGILALVACGISTMRELRYWKDNRTLFERALKVTGRNEIAYVQVSSALALAGDRDKAIEYCRRAIEIRPSFNDAWNQLAVLLAEAGNSKEALEAATTAIRLEPDFAAEAYYNRGTIWQDLHQPANALADFESVLKQNPEHLKARINLAMLLEGKGETDAAIQHYAAVLRLDPEDAVAHYNLASTLSRKGRLSEAIAHFERSIQLAPTNAGAHCNLGLMLFQQHRTEQALVHFQNALRLDPALAQAHYGIGTVLNQRGKTGEAIAHLKQSLQPNANFPAALNELATIYATHPDAEMRDGKQAVQFASRACELTASKNPLYLGTLAAAYAEAGNFSDAVATAEQALELARATGQLRVAERCGKMLELFRAGRAFREPSPASE